MNDSTQPTNQEPIRSAFGVALLIYSVIALASTFITLPMAIMGQLFDGSPDSAMSFFSAIVWLAPFGSIASGITGLITSAYIFTEHRIPKILGILLVLFITIPAATILFSFLFLISFGS